MIIALWVINILLALVFLMAGSMKAMKPKDALLASGMSWVENATPGFVKFVGVVEVLGALGLILPLATKIVPILTPIAAVALAITMFAAVVLHVRRKDDAKGTIPSLVLGLLSTASAVVGFIALG